MKAICTLPDGTSWVVRINGLPVQVPGPKKDEIVTITKQKFIEGIKCYELVEWKNEGDLEGWDARGFKPIADVDIEIEEQVEERADVVKKREPELV